MHYTPPSPADLRRLKDELRLTGEQMAELFGLGGDQQWRKYTGGAAPREMSMAKLFLATARLVLHEQDIERVLFRMGEIGAEVRLSNDPYVRTPSHLDRSNPVLSRAQRLPSPRQPECEPGCGHGRISES